MVTFAETGRIRAPERAEAANTLNRCTRQLTFGDMKLLQGQIWKAGDQYIRIVHLERLEVKYKALAEPNALQGTHHHVTKKEFCRLIKNGTLFEESPN